MLLQGLSEHVGICSVLKAILMLRVIEINIDECKGCGTLVALLSLVVVLSAS